MAENNNQDLKNKISNYIDYIKDNKDLTLPSGLGQDTKPDKFDYDEQLDKLAKENLSPIKFEKQVTYFRTYEAFDDHFTIINDVVLSDVPVLYNKFHSTNDVFVAETLRSSAPVVSSSGRQNWSLQMGLLFKPGQTQSDKLHRLVSVLQKFPITYIFNRRIHKALGIDSGDDTNTIFILESASMRNASDAVGAIVLDLNFQLFNYKPFSNHFWYNTRLAGYNRRIPEFDREKRLIDASGYEQSAFSTDNEAVLLHETLRELPDLFGETQNVPVPFPASSDCWMYYADHLQTFTPKISEYTNDFVFLTTKYFRQYKPPIPEARAGGDSARHANDIPFSPTSHAEFYNALANPEITSSDRKQSKLKKASGELKETKSDYNGNVKIVSAKSGMQFYGKILADDNSTLLEEAHRSITKVAIHPTKSKNVPDKYLDPEIIRRLNIIASRWPNKKITIISGIRNYPGGRGAHPKGLALDIRIQGVSSKDLFLFYATNFQGGFCEYVPNQNFVHIDARTEYKDTMHLWVDLSKSGQKSMILGGSKRYDKNNLALLASYQKTGSGAALIKEGEDLLDQAYSMRVNKDRHMPVEKLDKRKENAIKAAEEERREVDPVLMSMPVDPNSTNKLLSPDSIFDPEYTQADLEKDINKLKKDSRSEYIMRDADVRNYWIAAMSRIGLLLYREDLHLRNVFYRNVEFEVDSNKQEVEGGNGGIVLSAISMGFGHRIVPQKLLSQDTATFQFLGAGNKQGTMVFTFAGSKGRAAADNIKKIVYAARESARKYGALIPEAGVISLGFKKGNSTNSILALMATKDDSLDVVVSEIHESTSQSNPDTYQLVLEFIVQEKGKDEGLDRRFGSSFQDKSSIIKYVMERYLYPDKVTPPEGAPKWEWYQKIKPKPKYILERFTNNAEKEGVAYNEARNYNKFNGRFGRDSGYGRPYKLKDPNMPVWVANVILAAAELCAEIDEQVPPTNWRDLDGDEWYKKYSDWGAGELIKGRMKNIDNRDSNGLVKFQTRNHLAEKQAKYGTPLQLGSTGGFVATESLAFNQQLEENEIKKYAQYFRSADGGRKYIEGAEKEQMFKGDYEWDRGRSRHNITGTNPGGNTDKLANDAFDRFLAGCDRIYQMITVNMSDEANFSEYFGQDTDKLYEKLIGDLGGCYSDLYLPNIPIPNSKLALPLPPEFFIYDDSDEDPAISSLTDPANMEEHLYEHIDNEIKSVSRYIHQSVCGGSYLSRNLPNIAQQRKRYLDEFAGKDRANQWAGEMGYMNWEPMMSDGCKTWEPIFHNDYEESYKDPEKNSSKWMKFITTNELESKEYGTDIQLAWTDKLIKLSPYLRDGHTLSGESGWMDFGKEEIIETIYDNNWRALAFGPNQIHAQVDTVFEGTPPSKDMQEATENSKEEENTLGQKRNKAIESGLSVDVPEINVTYLDTGDVLIGRSVSTEYNDSLPQNNKPTNWWNVADTSVNLVSAGFAITGFGIPFAIGLQGYWRGGNNAWDEINDEDAKIRIKSYPNEKKFKTATHPNADKFSSGTDGIQKMAEMASGISFGSKAKDLSVRRAFPTFKIYFIEDDSHQTEVSGGQVLRAFDDFYSYSAIQEIRISRNRKVAADLATIRITNIGGKLLRKRWGEREKWLDEANEINGVEAEYATGIFADTEYENPFAKMILQDGVKVQIRLGYANEPQALETVFLGGIIEISPSEGGKIIEIVCQGFGAELEGVELGPLEDGPLFYSSQQALAGSIIQDSVVNFGRRSKFNKFNPGETRSKYVGGEGHGIIGSLGNAITMQTWRDKKLYKHFYRYPFRNFPQDDNIYAPPPSTYADFWDKFWNNACLYRPIKQTPWDIFQEHELRHPGYISLAVPYGHEPRMTMFFGAKAQHYWHHPPSAMEHYIAEKAADSIIRIRGMSASQRVSDELMWKLSKLMEDFPKLTGAMIQALVQEQSPKSIAKEIGRLFGRYRPFRNYHYFDSQHHILKNSIRSNTNGVYNEVEILYFKNENNTEEDDAIKLFENIRDLSLGEHGKYACKLDENIPEQYIKSYTAEFPSCVTEFMAKRYAQGLFARLLRDSYKGELIVLGEPTLKPYDICYMNDQSVNMTGPIEVEGVEHIFNRDHGWISIITPDLCVDVNDFFSITLLGVMGNGIANAWNAAGSNDIATAMTALASPIGYLGVMAGVKLGMWMQDGSPVIASPLTLGGKPFVSVSLGQDRVSLITSLKGSWNQYWDDLETGWAKVDIGETIFEETLDFQEWFYTLFNPSPGEGIAPANGG